MAALRAACGGSWAALGRELGVPREQPHKWHRNGRVPMGRLRDVAALAAGRGLPLRLEDFLT
jgi:hypothetical protein